MKFKKRPVIIDAWQWPGSHTEDMPLWLGVSEITYDDGCLYIETLKGSMRAEPNDWIIKGVKGELYPCKPDIFLLTYEAINE